MHKRTTLIIIIGIVTLFIAGTALALSNPDVDWWVISGGGGSSSGDVITVSDTIGQPVVGSSSGGDFSLEAGYWVGGIDTPTETYVFLPLVIK
jgi:hypothetical protein